MQDETRRLVEVRGGLIPEPGTLSSVDPEETTGWEQTQPRWIDTADWLRFQGYMGEILTAFGLALDTPGTERTPARFLKALYDATAGYEGDHKLLTAFPTEHRCDPDGLVSQIIEGPISFYSLCEHHVLPFHGFAHLGYIPHERIIGISKLTRLVRLFARRFTLQERLAEQIADALAELMEPHGVAVHLEAVHLCTQMRGVREEHSKTVTTVWRRGLHRQPEAAARVPGRGAHPHPPRLSRAEARRTRSTTGHWRMPGHPTGPHAQRMADVSPTPWGALARIVRHVPAGEGK
jgi:GTP cyclohydrolase I